MTAAQQQQSVHEATQRRVARTAPEINAAFAGYKKGMVDTIAAYEAAKRAAEPEEAPSAVTVEYEDNYRVLVPLKKENRSTQANAVSRWRTLAPLWCERVEERRLRDGSDDLSRKDVVALMRDEQSSAQLRAVGRSHAREVKVPRASRATTPGETTALSPEDFIEIMQRQARRRAETPDDAFAKARAKGRCPDGVETILFSKSSFDYQAAGALESITEAFRRVLGK